MDHPPLILVNGLLLTEPKRRLALDEAYVTALLGAGGVPLAFPPFGGRAAVLGALEAVDGVLLTGGDDFDTARLGLGPTHPAAIVTPAEKQELDLFLVRTALELELPILGVCYGMQCLGLAAGAGILQHLPDDRPGCRPHSGGVQHAVRIGADTKLAAWAGVGEMTVVSRHHQALERVPTPWIVSAVDDEGLVEAIERPDLPFALGVQWHPEHSPEAPSHARLFRGLVEAARHRRDALVLRTP